MNSVIFSLLAACCSALSSLGFRKNASNFGTLYSPSGYLLIFYFSSFIFCWLFYQDLWLLSVNWIMVEMGACAGILSALMMMMTFQALKNGPSGLTFAFQNASAVFPGLLLFLFLGKEFGFSCSFTQLMGMGLVLFGLFLGARSSPNNQSKDFSKWVKYALATFIIQILALTLIQGRCVLFDTDSIGKIVSNIKLTEADDIWFMPGLFGAASLMQLLSFLRENKKFQRSEFIYGNLGGITNFLSTVLLLLATKFALPHEKAIIFPCFAVATMIICNIWANRLYGEKFNLKTNAICSIGIFMAVLVI